MNCEYKTSTIPQLVKFTSYSEENNLANLNGDIKLFENELKETSITYNLDNNSNVTYQIVSSVNVHRIFNLKRDSKLIINQIIFDKSNDNIEVNLLEENSSILINTLIVSNTNININQHINHKSMHTDSVINNYGVSLANGNIYFNTIGEIKKGMAKSNCRQLSKGIVMEENSSVLSKPVLLIEEYDVIAYHGASIGKMSDDELFYLMSRGLSKNDAFKLILSGVVKPFIDNIMIDEEKNKIENKLNQIL